MGGRRERKARRRTGNAFCAEKVLAGSLPWRTGASEGLFYHPPPQPSRRHLPFRANPERDPVKRFRNLTPTFRHFSCCKKTLVPSGPPTRNMYVCLQTFTSQRGKTSIAEVIMFLPEAVETVFKTTTRLRTHSDSMEGKAWTGSLQCSKHRSRTVCVLTSMAGKDSEFQQQWQPETSAELRFNKPFTAMVSLVHATSL